ncbi:coiled-coil domain-containing protein 80 [Brachyhypopomus gauderio]|uniref:coiled-coil domain-containing protein 80 n=1 Tax=Brachyhypopomus gauderio TaxID=698409 RepID=UPI004043887C
MQLFQTHVVLCVLVWAARASGFTSSVGTSLRRTRDHAGPQSNADSVAQSSAISRNPSPLQAVQAMDSSRTPVRRVVKGRRPVPGRKPSNVSTPDAGPPHPGSKLSSVRTPNGATYINVLTGFAGRNRVLVISAPGESDGYYKLMMSLLSPSMYCGWAERHLQLIAMFHGPGETGGWVRRVGVLGNVTDQRLEPALVPRLMKFLNLEEGKFSMVLLRKTLQVEERYPYPVRLEALYETIDRTPMRRAEKTRQKGFVERCKAAGMEGQVVHPVRSGTVAPQPQRSPATRRGEGQGGAGLVPQPTWGSTTHSTTTETTRPVTTSTLTTTPLTRAATVPARLTVTPTATSLPPTTPNTVATTVQQTQPQTASHQHKAFTSSTQQPITRGPQWGRASTVTHPPVTTGSITPHRVGQKQQKISPGPSPPQTHRQKPVKDKLPQGKNGEPIEERGEEYEGGNPTVKEPEKNHMVSKNHKKLGETLKTTKSHKDLEENIKTTKDHKEPENNLKRAKAGASSDKADRKKNIERPQKPSKKSDTEKKAAKTLKEEEPNVRKRNTAKKGSVLEERGGALRPMEKPTEKSLETFLSYFEKRRRLLVITSPSEQNAMYTQQRVEYLEQVCHMALRKISIISIFGPLDNGTMKIDHYQMEQDKPVRVLPTSELIKQEVITAFRKHLGMLFNDFYMVLTDFDVKVKQAYEVPIVMKAVFDYIDTFSSRLREMELQRKLGIACKAEDKSRSLENVLSRFRWRRRLLVISTPDHDDWAYQQQLSALINQACNLGLRHVSVLKIVGRTMEDVSGVLELYPINGSASMEREDLTSSLARDIRDYFQVSAEYFSMLLVGKDGNVKSWYPSPVWSMSVIYDLIDSMQLRRQETAIQLSLGMHCPEEDYAHHDGYHDGYHHGYGY